MKEYFDLFFTFFRIGGLTFGGGYAMLPMIQEEVVEKRGWATNEEVMDYYAVGQCTPGIISVNTATFIGYKRKGVPGGIVATLGMVTPALIIITIIAAFIQNFADLAIVKNAFAGIRVCVAVLILNAVVKMWKTSVTNKFTLAVFLVVGLASAIFGWSPILLILAAALVGVAVCKRGGKEK